MPEIKEIEKTLEQLVGDVREATKSLDAKIEKGEGGQAELKAHIEKVEKAIDKHEEKNQELVASLADASKRETEAKERMDELEEKLIKINSSTGLSLSQKEQKAEIEKKALDEWCVTNEKKSDDMSQETKDYLRTDSNVDGGFLIQEQYDNEIIKPLTEVSKLRAYARNKRISSGVSLNMGLRTSLVQGYWTGEGEDFTIGSSKYARPNVPVHGMTLWTEITNKDLLASPYNMGNEILGDFRERMEQIEGAGFVSGNGVDKPRGFLDTSLHQASTETDVQKIRVINGSGSSTFTFDDTIDLTGELKDGYNPAYSMNRRTLAHIRKLKDSAGNYIWRAGNMGAQIPNQINGDPYVILPDMPDIGTDAFPLAYADWAKFYTIVDAYTAIVIRNQYIKKGFVVFTMEVFVGGDVTLGEAGVLLKTIA